MQVCIFIVTSFLKNARVAQLVEHSTDTRGVPSSNLGARTSFFFSTLSDILCSLVRRHEFYLF